MAGAPRLKANTGQRTAAPSTGLQFLPYDANRISADEFAAAQDAYRATESAEVAAGSIPGKHIARITMRRRLSNAGERFPIHKGPLSEKQIRTALEAYQHGWDSGQHRARPRAVAAAHRVLGGDRTLTRVALSDYFFGRGLSGLGRAMLEYEMEYEQLAAAPEQRKPARTGPGAQAAADAGGPPVTRAAAGAPPPAGR